MTVLSSGDMARTFFLQRQNVTAKTALTSLSQQLATGVASDIPKAVAYDFSVLTSIERALTLNDTYKRAGAEARIFTESAQNALQVVDENLSTLSTSILSASGSGTAGFPDVAADSAQQQLETLIGAFNGSITGRSLFAGQATDTVPLISAEALLDAVRPLAQAAATPEDMMAVVDAWFADGGDFSTTAYQGSDTPVTGFLVTENQKVEMAVTANRAEVRDALRELTKVALLSDMAFPNGLQDKKVVLDAAAGGLVSAQNGIHTLRAEVGVAEQTIETAGARTAAERTALQITRSDLVSADPYETATALEQASNQLETLYVLTARISGLKLTDYIR